MLDSRLAVEIGRKCSFSKIFSLNYYFVFGTHVTKRRNLIFGWKHGCGAVPLEPTDPYPHLQMIILVWKLEFCEHFAKYLVSTLAVWWHFAGAALANKNRNNLFPAFLITWWRAREGGGNNYHTKNRTSSDTWAPIHKHLDNQSA